MRLAKRRPGDIDYLTKTINTGRVELNLSPYATRTALPLIHSASFNFISPLTTNFKTLLSHD